MIYQSPKDWQDLQHKVCLVLNLSGFHASIDKKIKTPRGEIEIDVFATDPFSNDSITYIIECKNWENKIPQTVIHSFTTVMQEVGANVGYVISKTGFQSGAYDFTRNTNIVNLTFVEFQKKYLKRWAGNFFYPAIDKASDALIKYTEPINSRREKYIDRLTHENKKRFYSLKEKYFNFSVILLGISLGNVRRYNHTFTLSSELQDIKEINEFKKLLTQYSGISFNSKCYSGLLIELESAIELITDEFHSLFETNIFLDY